MKNKAERGGWQKRVKEEHNDRILTLLKENKTMRFKDFLDQGERTGIKSEKGLSEVLQRLQNEGLIEKTHVEVEVPKGEAKKGMHGEVLEKPTVKKQKEAYTLTTEGQKYQSWWLIHELLDLRDKNASYTHTLSSNYYNFGLSLDSIMSGKGGQLTFMLPPVPEIEDFIMSEIFKNIKEKDLKPESSEGKILLSFEIDFEKFTGELIRIQTFIEDIKTDKDVFSDERLYLSTTPNRLNRLWVLDHLINYSLFFGDQTFRTHLTNYLQNLSNKTNFTATFGEVDFEFVEKFVKLIMDNKEPLDDKRMLKRLIIKGWGTSVELPLFTYIKVAKVLNFGKDKVYPKLCTYENEKNNENFNPNSKLQRLIKEVRGNAK